MAACFNRLVLGLGLIGAIVLTGSSNVEAQAAKKEKKTYFKGKVISYDADLKLMRVAKGKQTVTLVVPPEIPMQIDSQPTTKKVAELPTDTYVSILLNADKSTGVQLDAQGPLVTRTIDEIDRENFTLKCHDDKKNVETVSFAADVPVTNDQVPGTLDDIKVGSKVFLKLSFDKSQALTIRVLKSKK